MAGIQKATQRLRKLFQQIDADGSGSISLEELLEGFDTNRAMQNMFSRLDLTRTDLEIIFETQHRITRTPWPGRFLVTGCLAFLR
jgi:hypothetical protein